MLNLDELDVKGLDILYSVQQSVCSKMLEDVNSYNDKQSQEYIDLASKAAYHIHELKAITTEIDKRKQNQLLYGIEDVYNFAGQFDKYTIFKFYKTSNAYKKYGEDVHGMLIYSKNERNRLEHIVTAELNYSRNDRKVFLNVSGLNEDKTRELKEDGFYISDVFEMMTMPSPTGAKQYKKTGEKEIPNTIIIPFETDDTDLERLQIFTASTRLKSGYKLLRHELIAYYSNLDVLFPGKLPKDIREEYLLNKDKSGFNNEADLKIHVVKYRRMIASGQEIIYLNTKLKERRLGRLEIVKKELGISQKQLEDFSQAFPKEYYELSAAIITFETETLTYHKTDYPIYWDFERFIHIYLRHYRNFFISTSTAKGTHFQYSYKDIGRLARILIEALKDEIETSLSKGKQYAKYANQGYYYNGNYYAIRIALDGKLMQFHPME